MVAAQAQFELPECDELHLVTLRKYASDLVLRWWERLFLHAVWLPVVRFGFKRMHIACPSAMKPDGTIEFLEEVGAYWEEEAAASACKDWRYGIKPFPVGITLPDSSVQYKGHKTPKSIMPDRYRRRSFPGVALGTRIQVAELTETLQTISRTATGQ